MITEFFLLMIIDSQKAAKIVQREPTYPFPSFPQWGHLTLGSFTARTPALAQCVILCLLSHMDICTDTTTVKIQNCSITTKTSLGPPC